MDPSALPDWLSVGLAFFGLFGSVAGGTYYGHVARTRHDDRRRVLAMWPEVTVTGGPEGEGVIYDFTKTLTRDRDQMSVAYGSWGVPVNAIVTRLPYPERALSMKLLSCQWPEGHEMAPAGEPWVSHAPLAEFRDFFEAMSDLEDYLTWKVNPTMSGRLRAFWARVRLLARGPYPWQVQVTPTAWLHPTLRQFGGAEPRIFIKLPPWRDPRQPGLPADRPETQ